jgi:cell wall assembly regulator SMI1
MSIESDWRAIEAELAQRSPQILADLRPPITEAEAVNWSTAAGELPASLRELYSVHAGTATRGGRVLLHRQLVPIHRRPGPRSL